MKKVRIIERTDVHDRVEYVIQQKHFLFKWMWVDGWINSMDGAECVDSFDTLEEAKAHLGRFDGTKSYEVVVYTNSEK